MRCDIGSLGSCLRQSDGVVCRCHTVTHAPSYVTPLFGGWRLDHHSTTLDPIPPARIPRIYCTMARGTHVAAILGPELYSRLPNTRVLLVGAGGIGCELCKSPPSHSSRDGIFPDSVRRSCEY